MRVNSTEGRPTRMGRARPSSPTTCTARSTRSSSPSANTMRAGPPSRTMRLAAENSGFMNAPECGRVATPPSIAALATAGAMRTIRGGSNGLGIRYSGPNEISNVP
ncbi:hypothetical protein G6F50_017905 [Rhizopus delemar]|uniref:Uncharacterized protein n=1 Tax=Rhizopus delemar TaxID=936053 RepID=A0A9P7BZ45_9FUNG|nr:hypothetical protein G6F50_017905 [Rhizopus delemar]